MLGVPGTRIAPVGYTFGRFGVVDAHSLTNLKRRDGAAQHAAITGSDRAVRALDK